MFPTLPPFVTLGKPSSVSIPQFLPDSFVKLAKTRGVYAPSPVLDVDRGVHAPNPMLDTGRGMRAPSPALDMGRGVCAPSPALDMDRGVRAQSVLTWILVTLLFPFRTRSP